MTFSRLHFRTLVTLIYSFPSVAATAVEEVVRLCLFSGLKDNANAGVVTGCVCVQGDVRAPLTSAGSFEKIQLIRQKIPSADLMDQLRKSP